MKFLLYPLALLFILLFFAFLIRAEEWLEKKRKEEEELIKTSDTLPKWHGVPSKKEQRELLRLAERVKKILIKEGVKQ